MKLRVLDLRGLAVALAIGGVLALLLGQAGSAPAEAILGTVRDPSGPVARAVVRVQGDQRSVKTGPDGSFRLTRPAARTEVTVTGWAPGYYVGWARARPGAGHVRIRLQRYPTTDNPAYDWFSEEGRQGSRSCGHCMPGHYAEWQRDAHSRAATNPRFLTTYNGTDVHGNRSPATRRVMDSDYGPRMLPPDPNVPYYGPGYKLDFPDSAGNCAACHAPAATLSTEGPYEADVNDVSGIAKEGVFCELCHKVRIVVLDPRTDLPRPNTPGVLSMRLCRPEPGERIFFGTFDDVTRRVSYLPLQRESAFCAPCHFGVFWDTVVYNSYGEWLDSPYSHAETGSTCQDCHMPVTRRTHFVPLSKGGVRRAPGGVFNHCMPGAEDVDLLQDTARLEVAASRSQNALVVTVAVTNQNGGHHIPTDHPSRQILLVVEATSADGLPLDYRGDNVLPDWAGVGDEENDYAGKPGKAYARVLQEVWTGVWPSIAYWNPTVVREDTRIPALATDLTRYRFELPEEDGPATIRVTLVYRRAFKDLARHKGWELNDILMEESTLAVP